MKQTLEAGQSDTVVTAVEPIVIHRKSTHPSLLKKQRQRTRARSRMRLRR